MGLFIWAWVKVNIILCKFLIFPKGGNFFTILNASSHLVVEEGNHVSVFFASLTGVIGTWATLSLNIMDFTRYTKSQRDQMLGQLYGLPTTTTFFAALGIFVTSTTILVYKRPIWNPVSGHPKFLIDYFINLYIFFSFFIHLFLLFCLYIKVFFSNLILFRLN